MAETFSLLLTVIIATKQLIKCSRQKKSKLSAAKLILIDKSSANYSHDSVFRARLQKKTGVKLISKFNIPRNMQPEHNLNVLSILQFRLCLSKDYSPRGAVNEIREFYFLIFFAVNRLKFFARVLVASASSRLIEGWEWLK